MPMKHIEHVISVIDYLEGHLSDKTDLDTVAEALHYSKYHLHRVFTDTVGITIHEYIVRRRLTEAAKLLVFSDRPILDIALAAGYKSQQAFTDIFTAMYKQPPNRYRESERFYPLQLKFKLEGNYEMLENPDDTAWDITFAAEEDIPCWMELVRLVVGGYPHLDEEEYIQALKKSIRQKEAVILKDGSTAVGILLFSARNGSIDFMGTHPLYRKTGVPGALLHKVMHELMGRREISITTYRDGDRADTGQRRELKELGFAEGELLEEYGYPTQRFVLANPIPYPDEMIHLDETNKKLDAALAQADRDVSKIDREYRDAKRYMAEYRGELDPHEMFQNELLLRQTDHTGAFSAGVRDRLAKLKDSPYFARIDFGRKSEDPEPFYIGRFTFRHDDEILVYDWRAPVSGMFYDYEPGPAGYDAPTGRIEGELTRKRQFKIRNGKMEYAIESSSHIQDDILQKELSHTSDEKMKSIITTIQKEQNKIIRSSHAGTMVIQGAAGSGKTSVALHRIAFLLYRFRDRLTADNVAILSPNKVFGDYISGVIPELAEEPVYELSFAEIAAIHLERVIYFESERNPTETEDANLAERMRYKSSPEFVLLMDRYIAELPYTAFAPVAYTCGRFSVSGEWIQKRFLAYKSHPLRKRLPLVAKDIFHRFESDNLMGDDLPKLQAVMKALTAMLTVKSPLALYKDFYRKTGHPELFVMPRKKTLEWTDVYPFLYLYAAYEGLAQSRITKHLVIDEMQDYAPIQYAVINMLFPCPKTILGDFGQSLNPYQSYSLDNLLALYEGAQFAELNKSYRSTYEIMTFAKSIRNNAALEPVARHGEAPEVICCLDERDELLRIKKAIDDFNGSNNASLGIILKTDKCAKALFDALSPECGLQLISPDSSRFHNGVTVTSVKMSKGLEFDEVILPHADRETYCSEHDRNLLYIACTRAMHRLTLLYTGECSGLLSGASCTAKED